MFLSTITIAVQPARRAAISLCGIMLAAAATSPAFAGGCAFEPQGEGRVAAVIDARTFRLQDGREVRLAGIEPAVTETAKANRASALAAIIAGREVTLHGEDDTPDRYGRQPALVFLASSETPVQAQLLAQGEALVAATITNKDCASILAAAEAAGREAKQGTWPIPRP
jgi:endonuclease YncB( thermonuclease family)